MCGALLVIQTVNPHGLTDQVLLLYHQQSKHYLVELDFLFVQVHTVIFIATQKQFDWESRLVCTAKNTQIRNPFHSQ